MRGVRTGVAFAALAAGVLGAVAASGHPLAPSLLELAEREDGRFDVTWKASLQQPSGSDVRPLLPAHCESVTPPRAEQEGSGVAFTWSVDCGEVGLVGETLRVRGLDRAGTDALVRVTLSDGRAFQAVLTAASSEFRVPERASALAVVRDYAALGVEHILTGWDHLLFVWGLLLLVAGRRALLFTITAFTVGHSVTLALAVLGHVDFPSAWIELGIALSILVLAVELTGEGGLLRRHPAWIAGGFGLLHGLGFAGALTEVGLPPEAIPLSLFAFNVGIELGQIAFVVAVSLAVALARPLIARAPAWAHAAPAYAIGSLAVFWSLERARGLLG